MVGLDVTHRAMLSAERADALRETGRAGAVVADLHAFYRQFHERVYGHSDTPVHDALAVAHVIKPDVITTEHLPVEIDITQGPCRGRTVVDQLKRTGRRANAHVAMDVDAAAFIDLLTERIARRLTRERVSRSSAGSARSRCAPAARSSASGRRTRTRSACASAAQSTRSSRSASASTRPRSTPARATTTRSCSTASRCPTRARAGSRTGLRGPSRIVDPLGFEWTDGEFRPPGLPDAVIYELHVGTFSPEGTFEGAIPYLQELADLGVTAIELMPVAEFPGGAAGATTAST